MLQALIPTPCIECQCHPTRIQPLHEALLQGRCTKQSQEIQHSLRRQPDSSSTPCIRTLFLHLRADLALRSRAGLLGGCDEGDVLSLEEEPACDKVNGEPTSSASVPVGRARDDGREGDSPSGRLSPYSRFGRLDAVVVAAAASSPSPPTGFALLTLTQTSSASSSVTFMNSSKPCNKRSV